MGVDEPDFEIERDPFKVVTWDLAHSPFRSFHGKGDYSNDSGSLMWVLTNLKFQRFLRFDILSEIDTICREMSPGVRIRNQTAG
jgi:hypothetical protein